MTWQSTAEEPPIRVDFTAPIENNMGGVLLELRDDAQRFADHFCDKRPIGPCLFCMHAIGVDHQVSRALGVKPLYEVNERRIDEEDLDV